MQSVPSSSPSGKAVWGKRVLIIGVIALFASGIGIYTQMDSMFDHTDPRISASAEITVDELAQFNLSVGCQRAWVLPEMADVDFVLQNMDGTEIESGTCSDNGREGEDLQPMGAMGEQFVNIGEWEIKQEGEFRALATCSAEAVKCEEGGKAWMLERDAILEGFMGEQLLLSSLVGCLCSLCLIPIGLTISVMGSNQKSAGGVMIIQGQGGETITAQPMQTESQMSLNNNDINALNAMASRGVVLNTDQVYSLVHGDEASRQSMIEELQEKQRRSEVPDPFSQPSTSKPKTEMPSLVPDSISEPITIDEEVKIDQKKEESTAKEPTKQNSWENWDEG